MFKVNPVEHDRNQTQNETPKGSFLSGLCRAVCRVFAEYIQIVFLKHIRKG